MVLIHFVGCNRTNFGREPLLMSWSLMCKSSSPRAKLIRSPHNPAQVQSCSLLHYLSCPPNNVRPHTANKSTSKTEKTCKFVKQTRSNKENDEVTQECQWCGDAGVSGLVLNMLWVFMQFPSFLLSHPWKSKHRWWSCFFKLTKCKSLQKQYINEISHRVIGSLLPCHVPSEMNAY